MSNYTDNPSMDEILARIKKALAERERKVEEEALNTSSTFERTSSWQRDEREVVSFEDVKDFASKPEVGEKIVDNIVKDEIFIKPNLSNESRDDVFVLSKNMEVNLLKKLDDIDFSLLCSIVAEQMAKDLDIAYMGAKVESWFKNNFWDMVEKSKQ